MNSKLKLYTAVDKQILFSDGVEEVIVYVFENDYIAETVSILLNDAYSAAYQDGLNASLNEQYKELSNKVLTLSIQNLRLKTLLNIDEEK
jgi:hypothetical protein